MRKGDLVRPIGTLAEKLIHSNRYRKTPAIVIKGPYEGTVTNIDYQGRPTSTEVKLVIDVMMMGKIVEGLPAADFVRVTRREASG